MDVDQLDVAYIAIGAKRVLDRSALGYSKMPFQGEWAYVQACIDQAERLGREWQACSKVFPGRWCYEVAEPFGMAFGRHLLAGGSLDQAACILDRIIATAMKTTSA
ncbi:hypothetical protein [Luteimonas sp. MC1825]|uniref:hypothetical protein n=1 Tax=Luteimonas sp. MC1825 TaxID=2761107 RepID=UPI0016141BFD|nr:hypothetical protein [Luteimonas sp. MC1825]MBB6600307.1 hypothetical protein [Luteimonas sp. MC1825]QOC87986.1 hypothetical protein IDM46_12315 [Luteimonas sp. MC1825]